MRKLTLAEAEEALQIDKNDLDEENIQQPALFFTISQQEASAQAVLAQLERDKANLNAELDAEIRQAYANKNEKITETALPLRIREKPEMQKINDEIIMAQRDVNIWAAMVESMRQRSKHILEEGALWRGNYYQTESSTSVIHEAKSAVADANRAAAGARRRVVRANGG